MASKVYCTFKSIKGVWLGQGPAFEIMYYCPKTLVPVPAKPGASILGHPKRDSLLVPLRVALRPYLQKGKGKGSLAAGNLGTSLGYP